VSHLQQAIINEDYQAALSRRKAADWSACPHVIMRPSIGLDGTAWCVLYGDNLQDGVAGFGDTPDAAMRAFDKAWLEQRTPAALSRIPQAPESDGGTDG
jgi:hypothetical protein